MARPLKTVNEIIKGKAAITAETAIQLERTLGISAAFWSGLESAYREHLARKRAEHELGTMAAWADDFPINDLVKHKLIEPGLNRAQRVAQLLSYFRVSSPDAFERHWLSPSAAFRSSPVFMASPKAVAAWLRWGEIEAGKIECQPFNARSFRRILIDIRPLTRRGPFLQVVGKAQVLCASAGVALVTTPELRGTRLSGATHWVSPQKAIIQLSLRHKTTDHFWFSFFHEAGHVLTGTRRQQFVDADDDGSTPEATADEDEANRFARDILLPPVALRSFQAAEDFTEQAIIRFADGQQIAAGIVVGRLQSDGIVPPAHFNNLKVPIQWA